MDLRIISRSPPRSPRRSSMMLLALLAQPLLVTPLAARPPLAPQFLPCAAAAAAPMLNAASRRCSTLSMHGGAHAHSHSHDDEPLFVRPSLKPLVLSWGLFWMNMRRHSLGRSELKKASYADGEASRITWVGAAVNLFLSISKLVAGIVGNSAAMLSDAGHSLSDLVSDALTLVTLRMSALPPDIDHPYGHGRFESVGSLGIATLLLLAGLSFGQNAFAALRAPSAAPISVLALWAAVASIVFKEVLYRRAASASGCRAGADRERVAPPLDALSVVALVGIGGLLGWRVLDPLAGLVVAAMVAAMVRIGADALAQLTDTADYLLVQRATKSAEKVVGRARLGSAQPRDGGTTLVDLAIQVDSRHAAHMRRRCATPSSTTATTSPRFWCTSTSRCTTRPCSAGPPLGAHPRRRRGAGARRLLNSSPSVEVPRVVHYQETGGITLDAQLRVADADAAPLGDSARLRAARAGGCSTRRPTSRTCRSRSFWTTSTRRRRRTRANGRWPHELLFHVINLNGWHTAHAEVRVPS